jgi:hypothetical protein
MIRTEKDGYINGRHKNLLGRHNEMYNKLIFHEFEPCKRRKYIQRSKSTVRGTVCLYHSAVRVVRSALNEIRSRSVKNIPLRYGQ